MSEKQSPGSWNLRELKDTRENVMEAVQSAAFVPDAFKAALIGEINQMPENVRLIRVDAHCQVLKTQKGIKRHGHWDISEV